MRCGLFAASFLPRAGPNREGDENAGRMAGQPDPLEPRRENGERYLAGSDRAEQVLAMRRAYQEAMSADCISAIEHLAGRTVIAFMSANHIDPDLAAEIFVLEPQAPPAA